MEKCFLCKRYKKDTIYQEVLIDEMSIIAGNHYCKECLDNDSLTKLMKKITSYFKYSKKTLMCCIGSSMSKNA